jgi:hypothetical protein
LAREEATVSQELLATSRYLAHSRGAL